MLKKALPERQSQAYTLVGQTRSKQVVKRTVKLLSSHNVASRCECMGKNSQLVALVLVLKVDRTVHPLHKSEHDVRGTVQLTFNSMTSTRLSNTIATRVCDSSWNDK